MGHSCDFWGNYEADLQRNVDMGCTAMRFSLEWHRIVPRRSQVDPEGIAHYHRILDTMDRCAARRALQRLCVGGCLRFFHKRNVK